ncbi:MAG: GNAT family N-acetyltransferase [Pseudomonadota bacterium]
MKNAAWREDYKRKLVSAEQALSRIGKGARVFVSSGCGEPQHLIRALSRLEKPLADTEVLHIHTLGVAPYTQEKLGDRFRLKTFFIGKNVRDPVGQGRADYSPIHLSDVPGLFARGQIRLDVALIQVSPPDHHGYCSLGVSVDIVKAATENASVVVAQVNTQMPRVLGDSFIHVDDLDAVVESDEPLLELTSHEPNEISEKIGVYIADLIDDGSTIQIGYGSIPNACCCSLLDKRHLGVHTEMFSDGLINLIEAGAVDNSLKTLHRGKLVASFAMGSRRLYDFIHNNPMVEFHPSDYTNDPFIIARNDRMAAINSALEVDLTGQVASDSIGFTLYSGIGGQADFIRGAARSNRGRPIIALPSTTEAGKSRIVPHISTGGGVTISRGDVHYVITEYGVAYLHGKTLRERALALVSIAHPDHREALLAAAKERHLVYQDQMLPPAAVYPKELERFHTLKSGEEIFFRPIKPTDERALQELFYSLAQTDIYRRFHCSLSGFSHRYAQPMVNVDFIKEVAIVAVAGGRHSERIVALARYILDERVNLAEVDFTVHGQWHGKGIGRYLMSYLIEIASRKGISGLTAYILQDNLPMLALMRGADGHEIESIFEDGACLLTLRFSSSSSKTGGRG